MDAKVTTERPPVIKQRKERSDKGVKKGARGSSVVKPGQDDKAIFIGVLSIAVDTIYRTAAINNGDHWKLTQQENLTLSLSLHEALETLPGDVYGNILEFAGKYGPWAALAWTAYGITKPRLDATRKLNAIKEKASRNNKQSTVTELRNNIGERFTVAPASSNESNDTGVAFENYG